jgi:hypothetical protein
LSAWEYDIENYMPGEISVLRKYGRTLYGDSPCWVNICQALFSQNVTRHSITNEYCTKTSVQQEYIYHGYLHMGSRNNLSFASQKRHGGNDKKWSFLSAWGPALNMHARRGGEKQRILSLALPETAALDYKMQINWNGFEIISIQV